MTYMGRRFLFSLAVVLVTLGAASLNLATADTVNTSASVSREAYFTYPITQTAPPLIRNGFPPSTACLVAGLAGVPQICGSQAQQVAALLGLTDGIPILVSPDGDLAQPIALPGTTPVGMFGGQTRYVSLMAFNLPPLQDGQRFAKFELVLQQNGFNFAVESPATRDVVLNIIRQAEDADPALVAESITKALTGEIPLATETLTGIEACPVTTEWSAGRAQGASLDGTRVPKADCLTGTTAVFNDDGTVTFDITFAVQAWTEGLDGKPFANQGIIFRPIGAPNLAYGDPDFSTNWVVSLADSTNSDPALRPRVRYETVTDEDDAVIDPGGEVDFSDTGDDSGLDFGSDDGSSLDDGSDGGSVGSDDGSNGGGGKPRAVASTRKAQTPGWLWFLLPLVLIFAFVFDEALSATPAALRRRPGALTALEARRAASSEGDE